MHFDEIEFAVRGEITELLNDHLSVSAEILAKDKCLLPMLMIRGETLDSKQIISLQPKDGSTDVDKAYDFVVRKLKTTDFNYAVFSYSTQIGLDTGKQTAAVKSIMFAADGLSVVSFVPYKISGFLKRQVTYGQVIILDVIQNVFEDQ